MITLAPIVIGFWAKKSQRTNLDAGGLEMLTRRRAAAANAVVRQSSDGYDFPIYLDRDGDGSSMIWLRWRRIISSDVKA